MTHYRRNSSIKPPAVVTVASFLETARKLGKMTLVEVMETDPEFASMVVDRFQAILIRRWENKHGMTYAEFQAQGASDQAPLTEKQGWQMLIRDLDKIFPDYPDLIPALKKVAEEEAARA